MSNTGELHQSLQDVGLVMAAAFIEALRLVIPPATQAAEAWENENVSNMEMALLIRAAADAVGECAALANAVDAIRLLQKIDRDVKALQSAEGLAA